MTPRPPPSQGTPSKSWGPGSPPRVGLLTVSLLLASGVGAGGVWAQAGIAPHPAVHPEAELLGFRADGLTDAARLLESAVEDGVVAGAVAGVMRGGRLVFLQSTGVQDVETSVPMTSRSLFRIYSMTKPVTAVAVMILVEEGRVELDAPMARYLPEFQGVAVQEEGGGPPRTPSRPITVRDLLLHTSGMSHRSAELYQERNVRDRRDALPDFVRKITEAPLLEDPGTRFRYSEATTALGHLVEVLSGLPFDRFLEQRIFAPLGMHDTGFWVKPHQRHRFATVHRRDEGGRLVHHWIESVGFLHPPPLLEGAVGLVSSVPDYLRFSQFLLNRGELDGERLLGRESVEALTTNGLAPELLALRSGTMGWGMASVNVVLEPEALAYPANPGEYGWDGTGGTIFWVDPTTETVIVLMTQSVPSNPEAIRQRFKTAVHDAMTEGV